MGKERDPKNGIENKAAGKKDQAGDEESKNNVQGLLTGQEGLEKAQKEEAKAMVEHIGNSSLEGIEFMFRKACLQSVCSHGPENHRKK